MARSKRRVIGIDNKLILNVIGASLIVQKAPDLIKMFIPLDPTVTNIAGVGAGYLVGVMLRNPQLANASLALGITGFIQPIVDNLIRGGTPPLSPASVPGIQPVKGIPYKQKNALTDFVTLNDYIDDPSIRQSYMDYDNVY